MGGCFQCFQSRLNLSLVSFRRVCCSKAGRVAENDSINLMLGKYSHYLLNITYQQRAHRITSWAIWPLVSTICSFSDVFKTIAKVQRLKWLSVQFIQLKKESHPQNRVLFLICIHCENIFSFSHQCQKHCTLVEIRKETVGVILNPIYRRPGNKSM